MSTPSSSANGVAATALSRVLSILLVLPLIAAGLVVWQQAARSAQHTAIARGMVAQADRIGDRDSLGALHVVVAADQFRILRAHPGTVYGVAFAPDGRTLVTASEDRTMGLWDVSDRDRPRQLGQPLTAHGKGHPAHSG